MTRTNMKIGIQASVLSLFFIVFALGVWGISTPAKADLTILPIRVMFEDRDRSAELTLVNTSKTTNTYRLEWGHRRMKEEGGYEHLDAPLNPAFNPDETLIFSPRQVTIAPGQSQRVRISLRRPADLPDGEYRAHLVMKKVATSGAQNQGPSQGLAVQMNTNVGFSVPVIVRQGAYDTSVTISNPHFLPRKKAGDPPYLKMTINRTGKYSITGALRVYWTPPGGQEKYIGQANNLNIFHEIDQRHVAVALRENNITAGTIRVAFEGIDRQRGTIFAEQRFPVGG